MCPCFARCSLVVAGLVQLACLGLAVLVVSPDAVEPAEMQVRRFTIFIDGKEAGSYRQEIRRENGEVTVHSSSGFELPVFVVRYKYAFNGRETWSIDWRNQQRLKSLQSSCDDHGETRQNAVSRQAANFRIVSNGSVATATEPLWTTTFWTLPSPAVRQTTVQLLDLDTGRVVPVTLTLVAKEKVVGRDCSRWAVRGQGFSVDLWFDDEDRLVMRQMTRKGRPVVLQLAAIQ